MELSNEDSRVYEEVTTDLGEIAALDRLKSEASMRQNLKRAVGLRQPSVYLATLKDSQKIKVTTVESEENIHFNRITDVLGGLGHEEALPSILKITSRSIYCDFVEGKFPDLESESFVHSYAGICARLHSTTPAFVDKGEKTIQTDSILESPRLKRKIGRSMAIKLKGFFEVNLPDSIRSSYTYADLTADNFVADQAGNLKLIDIGSLQKDRLTDIFLFSHPKFQSLCDRGFWEAYEAAGGPRDISGNTVSLKALGNLEFIALALESLKDIPLLDWRKRRSRKVKIHRLIKDLISVLC